MVVELEMKLYSRDYRIITSSELEKYQAILKPETEGQPIGRINMYDSYPTAVKHYLSLFPNNHINLCDMKKQGDLQVLNDKFKAIVHSENALELDVLSFINKTPAYHIIGSIFECGRFNFGHHEAYLFPEFSFDGKYRADYLLIGKGSGGYEFVFIEFERSNGRITLKDGNLGEVFRKGINQISDWQTWLDANFQSLGKYFEGIKGKGELPEEFLKYDTTRMHYVVVAGLRSDFDEKTYRLQRDKLKKEDIKLLQYDNLCDSADRLLDMRTF